MAFTHGKKGRLWMDGVELTTYFSEFAMNGKAGVAETTVFGLGAKTYIGGLLEGTITGKGYFGSSITDIEDSELSGALGRNQNMAVTFSPTGATAAGTRVVSAYAAETDLQLSAPVTGVVAFTFSAQADSGLSTGVFLYDPTSAAIVTATTTNGTGVNDTGVADSLLTFFTGTNGTAVSTFTGTQSMLATNPQAAGFPTAGYLGVVTNTGEAILTYNGTSSTAFLNCNLVSGTGTIATSAFITVPYSTLSDIVCNAHVFTTGSADTITIQIQHSDDGATWVNVPGGAFAAITAPGGYSLIIPNNTLVLRFLRATITTVGATISATLGISVARQ